MHDILITAIPYMFALAVFGVAVLYFMAYDGLLMDYQFGRAVRISTFLCVGIAYLFFDQIMGQLIRFGAGELELVLICLGIVFASGIVGAFFDLIAWLRREDELPPPFQN